MSSIGQIRHGGPLEFSGRTSGCFLTAMHSIAEHFSYHFLSTQEMDLETMRLFCRARFGVDAFDVRFGIRVGSFSHEFIGVAEAK